jgi:hypothetical protein
MGSVLGNAIMRNTSWLELAIKKCGMHMHDLRAICAAVRANNNLMILTLHNITAEHMDFRCIADMIWYNKSLKHLNLFSMDLDPDPELVKAGVDIYIKKKAVANIQLAALWHSPSMNLTTDMQSTLPTRQHPNTVFHFYHCTNYNLNPSSANFHWSDVKQFIGNNIVDLQKNVKDTDPAITVILHGVVFPEGLLPVLFLSKFKKLKSLRITNCMLSKF